MRKIILFLFAILMISGCGQSSSREVTSTLTNTFGGEARVMVYYFHGKQRCPTCIAIQKVTEDAYAQYLSDNKDIKYKEVDISLKENESLAGKYEIVWSSLVVASEKDHKNLTEYAFGLAMRNPEILKELIVKEANSLLNEQVN